MSYILMTDMFWLVYGFKLNAVLPESTVLFDFLILKNSKQIK
ncbi:hypothetical protein [Phascolarctobacterium succinatutens]